MTLGAMLRLWLPSAISVSLLNLELPVISLILAASNLAASADYALALSTFMFANAFVFPLCTLVVKERKRREVLVAAALLALTTFLLFNAAIAGWDADRGGHLATLLHLFSFSLLAVALRRYLQGCCILAGETRPMSRASLLRVLISTLGCYLLVQQGWPVDLAAITALVAAAWLESLLLALLLWRRAIPWHAGHGAGYRSLLAPYGAAFLMTASALMSNLVVVLCLGRVEGGEVLLAYWPLTFGLLCVAIGTVLDLEGILLKILDQSPPPQALRTFLLLQAGLPACLFLLLGLLLDHYALWPAGSRDLYLTWPFLLGVALVAVLWVWRGERRARLLRANRLGPIHLSVPLALLTPLLLFHLLVIPNPGMLISLLIFALPIALELGCYLLTPCHALPWQEKTEGA